MFSKKQFLYYIEAQCQQGLKQDLYGRMKDLFCNIILDNHVLM